MEDYLKAKGTMALELAGRPGVEAEAFLLYDRELQIEVSDQEVETVKEAEEIGIGLRVINRGRLGFAYSTDLSGDRIRDLVRDALAISEHTAYDAGHGLPGAISPYPEMDVFDPEMGSRGVAEKIALAQRMEKEARAYDRRVQLVERSVYQDSEMLTLILNSRGVEALNRANYAALYISLVAEEDGDVQNGFSMQAQKRFRGLDPVFVGREAAARAVDSLQARGLEAAGMACILDPQVVVKFMGLLSASVSADAVQKGKSMLAGLMDQEIAVPEFNLVDDACLDEGISSFPFDGEGVASRRNPIIAGGVLKTFLYDSYSANKAGRESNGCARRASFRSLPAAGTSNLILTPGAIGPGDMLADTARGVLITEVMGMHTANPFSGDFSLGAAGFYIAGGKILHPVRGITIAGNVMKLLKDIEAVGSDLRFFGSRAAPTLKIKSLSISA